VILIRSHGVQKALAAKTDLQRALGQDRHQVIVRLPSDIMFVLMSVISKSDEFVDQYVPKVTPYPILLYMCFSIAMRGHEHGK